MHASRRTTRLLVLLVPAALLGLASCTAAPTAEGSGRAAIAVVHGDGRMSTACVAFEGDSLTGEDLLLRSGFASSVDPANALGLLVCAIDGEGCAFPDDPCLCRCRGAGGCSYWAYFNQDPQAGWTYAVQGARLRRLHDGDLDAWLWLDRAVPGDQLPLPPEDVTFESICRGS